MSVSVTDCNDQNENLMWSDQDHEQDHVDTTVLKSTTNANTSIIRLAFESANANTSDFENNQILDVSKESTSKNTMDKNTMKDVVINDVCLFESANANTSATDGIEFLGECQDSNSQSDIEENDSDNFEISTNERNKKTNR